MRPRASNAEAPAEGAATSRGVALRWSLVGAAVTAAIIVPFVVWGDAIAAWVAAWIAERRPGVAIVLVLGGLLAADVVLPVPSSLVAVAAGMRLGFVAGVATIAVGSTIGCAIGWAIGRGLGRPGLRRFVGEPALARLDALALRYGAGALLVARAVPVLAEASVIVAGAGRFDLRRTVAWTAAANVVIALVYAGAGELAVATAHPEVAMIVALGAPGLAIIVARALRRPRDGSTPA